MRVQSIGAYFRQRQSRAPARGMRLTRVLTVWLALLAVTLNALWPLLVNAQPKSIPQEICSVGGARTISGAAAGPELPAPHSHHEHHDKMSDCCTSCVSGVHAAALAPAPAGLAFNLQADPLLLASADAVTWKCPYYLPTLSRGPPASPI